MNLLDFSNLNELYELGIMYYYGLEVQKDRKKAFQIFTTLSERKYSKASIMLQQIEKMKKYEVPAKKKR